MLGDTLRLPLVFFEDVAARENDGSRFLVD